MGQSEGLIGEKLGSFRIEAVLGSGAMGVVYRGTNEKTGKAAAVKVVGERVTPKGARSATGSIAKPRSSSSSAIPTSSGSWPWGRFRGTSYIAMEYVQGETLDKVIARPRAPALARGGRAGDPDVRRAPLRTRAWRRPPRFEAVQPDGHGRRQDQADGFRDRQGPRRDGADGHRHERWEPPPTCRPNRSGARRPSATRPTSTRSGSSCTRCWSARRPSRETRRSCSMHCHLNEPPPRPSAKVAEIPKKLDELIVTLMAKSPTDRPWDAAAVGAQADRAARQGRARRRRSRWSGPRAAATRPEPSRGPAAPGDELSSIVLHPKRRGRKRAKPARREGTRGSAVGRSTGSGSFDRPSWFNRATIETALLALALVAIGGFIAYGFGPPARNTSIKHAEALMASSRRADWLTARDDYIKSSTDDFPTTLIANRLENGATRSCWKRPKAGDEVLDERRQDQLHGPR